MHLQIIFKNLGDSLAPDDIIASYIVHSKVECSLKCVQKRSCVGYNYKAKSYNHAPNCQITNKTRDIDTENGEWTFYQVIESATVSKCLSVYFG